MKPISRPFYGGLALLLSLSAGLGVFLFTSWGKDNQLALTVSGTPVNRDVRGNSYAPVVKKVAPSVVNIYTTRFVKERLLRNPLLNDPIFRQFFGNPGPGNEIELTHKEQSLGSGVIVTPDGYILTANHVVADADEIKVGVPGNKTVFPARVIGKDPATDIAVLKIQSDHLPAVTLADSDQVEVGDVVLAVGNPFGIGQTVTMGMVSALGRTLPGRNPAQGARYQDFIQTDAAINPGNSGGALVDAEGRLIGINDAIISPSGGNNGIGLAVPVNMARHVLERLVSGGKVERGYLGVMPQDIDAGLAKQFNLPDQNGALVADVMPGTPAARAGIKSGDVITAVNSKPVNDAHDLQLAVSELAPGSPATFKIIRNGFAKNIPVTLEELPGTTVATGGQTNAPADGEIRADALNGVNVADLNPQIRRQLGLPDDVQGAIVTTVAPGSNSAAAGLQPNDVILEINRQSVASAADAARLGHAARSERILVKIWRRAPDFVGTRFLSVDNARRGK
jgi:serine protease Do